MEAHQWPQWQLLSVASSTTFRREKPLKRSSLVSRHPSTRLMMPPIQTAGDLSQALTRPRRCRLHQHRHLRRDQERDLMFMLRLIPSSLWRLTRSTSLRIRWSTCDCTLATRVRQPSTLTATAFTSTIVVPSCDLLFPSSRNKQTNK